LKFKEKGGFKATDKKAGTPAATSALAALGGLLMATVHSVSHFSVTMGHRVNAIRMSDRQALAAAAAAAAAEAGGGEAAAATATADTTPYVTASSAFATSVTEHDCKQDELGRAQQRSAVRGSAGLPTPIAEAVEQATEPAQGGVTTALTACAAEAGTSAVPASQQSAVTDTLEAASARASQRAAAAAAAAASSTQNMPAQQQQQQAITAKHANAGCWPFGSSANPTPGSKATQKQPKQDISRRCDWLRSNIEGLGWRLDPWVLLVSLGISVVAVAAGAWQIAQQRERFDLRSSASVTEVRLASCLLLCLCVWLVPWATGWCGVLVLTTRAWQIAQQRQRLICAARPAPHR
jgi:hypothetical protein